MNARGHYAEAERLLRLATDDPETPDMADVVAARASRWLAAAQAHAQVGLLAAVLESRPERKAVEA